MWVWSDELVSRFPEVRTDASAPLPLLAIEVGAETDLESVARAVVREHEAIAPRAVATRELPEAAAR